MSTETLLIFARNPVYGKVKTRLAATIGHESALRVYEALIEYTAGITKNVGAARIVCYSDFIASGDAWDNTYEKALQKGIDLGERMANAFIDSIKHGAKKTVIIGTDCYELTTEIIELAFAALDTYDIVVGPALDGGYYLLGMKTHHPEFFADMEWSTDTVLKETLSRCTGLGLRSFLLPVLSDIDEEKDLLYTGIISK